MKDETILVTGAAGFIGFHVAQRLLSSGRKVVGLDSVNDYYDPALKEARLDILKGQSKFTFVKSDLADREATRVAIRAVSLSRRHSSRGPGRCALFAGKSARLYGCEYRRLPECARGMPPSRLRASSLCFVIVGLWRQYQAAVFGAGQCRSSDQPLCGVEKSQRADGACL